MNEIPPPSDADIKTDIAKAYRCCALLPDLGGDVVACFIRLLAAARRDLAEAVELLKLVAYACRSQSIHCDLRTDGVMCPSCRAAAFLKRMERAS